MQSIYEPLLHEEFDFVQLYRKQVFFYTDFLRITSAPSSAAHLIIPSTVEICH